jgi:hypothetical protein
MNLTYSIDDTQGLNIVVKNNAGEQQSIPFLLELNGTDHKVINKEVLEEFKSVLLFNELGFSVNIGEIVTSNYNSTDLYEQKWKNELTANDRNIGQEDFFNALKTNAKSLYTLIRTDTKLSDANKTYINTDEHQKFMALNVKRQVLLKICTMLFVSFTVADVSVCNQTKSSADKKAKQDEYDKLVNLVKDTTRILLNIDALPENAVSNANSDYGTRTPPGAVGIVGM